MTGFGKAETEENGTRIIVEVHSVNSRFLDTKLKVPRVLYEYEDELRKLVQRYIERGRVSLEVSIEQPGARLNSMSVDFDLAGRYVQLADELVKRYDFSSGLDVRTLLSLPDILKYTDNNSDYSRVWDLAEKTAVAALEAHSDMREKEGESIGRDISARLEMVRSHMDRIHALSPEAQERYTATLRRKIETLIGSERTDETRFAMEVAMYADRVDITEECVRFGSHCDVFASEIQNRKTSGKKLSFLLQEMNREINTIGSKSNDAAISHVVVQIKEELEKMREQSENME